MTAPQINALTVTMSEISLSPHLLDNLASEYYGVIPSIAGSGDHSDKVCVHFRDLIHPVFKTTIKGIESLNGFCEALDSFRVSSSDPSI